MSTLRKFPAWEVIGVRLSALMTFLMGMINLFSALQPTPQSRLAIIEPIFPLEVRHGSRITSVLAGFALIVLAVSLWRRKRTAWILTISLLGITCIADLIKGLEFEEASLAFGILILLVLLRHSFHAVSDRPSTRQGLVVLATAFLFTMIYGVAGFYLLDRHFSVHFSILQAIRQTIVMFTAFYNPGIEPLTGFGRYFAGSIYIIGLGTLSFSLVMLIRPVLVRQSATREEKERAEEIVQQYGRTALARATLFDDKSYYFAGDHTVIAYAARGRSAVVLGDPIGPPEHAAESIVTFRDFCTHNDWTPAFVSTLPDYLDDYKAAGFEAVCIGYEAIVSLKEFSLEGSKNKAIRNAVSRMERLGYRTEVYQPPLENGLLRSLRDISDAWLTLRHGGEMHFSDGWFDEEYIRNGPVIAVINPEGGHDAFANLVPEYQKNELSIDLMRHYPNIANGMMEFLFVRLLQWAKEQGFTSFSLGLSAIVGVGEKPGDPRIEQALHTISEYLSRFYNFKGLHHFKENFHPNWEPRYLVYPGVASLPLVMNTLLKVHSGDNVLWKFLRD